MVFYKNGSVRTNEQGTVDSDGMSSWNLWSLSDRNNPLCAFVSTRFLQVGDWRIGKTDHDILSIGHRNGKMVQLYSEHGGTGAALRTDEMVSGTSMSRYNPWKLPRGNVLQGTASGCTYDKFPSWSALKTAQAEYN